MTYCIICEVISAGTSVVLLWKFEKLVAAVERAVMLTLKLGKEENREDKEMGSM